MFIQNSFKKKLLLILAAGFNFWDSYMTYSAQRYRQYFGFWKRSTIFSSVSRLLTVGDIEKVIKNGEVFLRLTSKGYQKFQQDIPIFKYSQKIWDGYWRLAIFDIPEQNKGLRQSLRNKLVSLGLGQLQKSVYITPFNLEQELNDFLKTQKIFGFCFCLKAKRLGLGDDREIARIAFKLEQINEKYHKIIDKIDELEILFKERKLKAEVVSILIENYLNLILQDPGLPKELLPKVWWYDEAKKSFKNFLFLIKNTHKA